MGVQNGRSAATHYRNVDLDIYSRHDLRPLIKGFGAKVHVLFVGRERGKYCAHLEVAQHPKTADSYTGILPAGRRPSRTRTAVME